MTEIRIAMITRDYPPKTGGISTHTEALVRSLRSLGADVQVFSGGGDLRTLAITLGISFKEYDVVHVQSTPYGLFVRGAPMVITVHETVLAELRHYSALVGWKGLPAYVAERLSLRKAKAIIAVSETAKRELVSAYGVSPGRISVISNGVDARAYSVDKEDDGLFRVLVVSRLEKRKNVLETLEALVALRKVRYRADVIGEGSERGRLEAKAKRLDLSVNFHGRVGKDELARFYSRADVVVSSARSEGFGLAVIEGAAAGCAIVASDIPAHRELFGENGCASLYGSPKELEEILVNLASNRESRMKMGKIGRELALSKSWEKAAEMTLRTYQDVSTMTLGHDLPQKQRGPVTGPGIEGGRPGARTQGVR